MIGFEDFLDVVAGFGEGRDTLIFAHGSGSGVVGGKGTVGRALVLDEQIAEMASAGVDVLKRVMRVGVELSGSTGHQLHEPDGSFGRDGAELEAGFDAGDGVEEFGRQAVTGGGVIEELARFEGGERSGLGEGLGRRERRGRRGDELFLLDERNRFDADFNFTVGSKDFEAIAELLVTFGADAEAGGEDDLFGSPSSGDKGENRRKSH